MAQTYSEIRVKRLARKAVLAGIVKGDHKLYDFLAQTGDEELNNLVLIELGWWTPPADLHRRLLLDLSPADA